MINCDDYVTVDCLGSECTIKPSLFQQNKKSLNESSSQLKGLEKGKIVIDFSNVEYCGPCKKMAPIFAEKEKEYKKYGVVFIDVQITEPKNSEIISKFGITSVPTFVGLNNGEIVDVFSGADVKKLDTLIRKVIVAK